MSYHPGGEREDFYLELLIVLAICWLLIGTVGCAEREAVTVLKRPPVQSDCGDGIPVCEKINKRDRSCWRTYCLSQRELEEMTRQQ